MPRFIHWAVILCFGLVLALGLVVLWPVQTLEIATVDGVRRWCAVVQSGELVAYLSMNSIYRVPVTEWWAIKGETIRVTRVDSTPIVLDYYNIVDYQVDANGQASGDPQLTYTGLRMALTEQGQQRVHVGERIVVLADLVSEGSLTIHTRLAPRLLACRF